MSSCAIVKADGSGGVSVAVVGGLPQVLIPASELAKNGAVCPSMVTGSSSGGGKKGLCDFDSEWLGFWRHRRWVGRAHACACWVWFCWDCWLRAGMDLEGVFIGLLTYLLGLELVLNYHLIVLTARMNRWLSVLYINAAGYAGQSDNGSDGRTFRSFHYPDVLSLHIQNCPDGHVVIMVTGDDKKAVGALKVRVESLVGRERLDASYWHHSFFTAAGQRFLHQVHKTCGAYVRTDTKIQALRVYGNTKMVDKAKELIKEEVERLSLLEWVIPLKRQSVGYFVRQGLAALKEVLGEDNVSLDLASMPCRLTIKGGDEARHHLSRLLDESLTNFSLEQNHAADGDDICLICYDTVPHPESLGCGHTYCTACLRHYLTLAQDTKKFPLVCMVAFLSYLDKHPQELKYCTTPDCSQIYQSNSTKAVLQCPSCLSTICPSCHEEAHEGITCDERKFYSSPAEQERLTNEWAAMNGVKKCPTCGVWLEKTEGCNHMSCKCGAHICWRCMGVFTAETIYAHMETEHGGIYDVAPQWIN
ncbi:uncharacterized protein LACBIDRAFT_304985 [Laccaria bicolor S238N-H82]|uniref:RBR-type E3 ubiquitin transferase n=1 Tax=Laccaria bicolor (strain S238N-H82 / ATCC MYA-4686) TaxID=486041 RepID=B0CT36_LACBS|nr:uncharacterized protein LACBIDRAFT_304985 [Laccaria bicolor S238N-H82]EDR13870.1 predicted protein [Laccaria bicolor S238N-H82]|eukprot:XP_001874429.1 predicted protein [Laccaria bicolor S238N-H82]